MLLPSRLPKEHSACSISYPLLMDFSAQAPTRETFFLGSPRCMRATAHSLCVFVPFFFMNGASADSTAPQRQRTRKSVPLPFSASCLGHQNNRINFQLLKEAKSPRPVACRVVPPSSWHTFLSLPHTVPPLRHYYFSHSFCQMPLSLFWEHNFYPLPHPGLNLIFLRRFSLGSPPLHNLFCPFQSTFIYFCPLMYLVIVP